MIFLKRLFLIIVPVLICSLILSSSVIFKKRLAVRVDTPDKSTLPIIILDAGHGGFDGGATANDGTVEKDINLKITLYLREYLNLLGFDTIVTREQDVSLEDNPQLSIKSRKTSDIHNRMKIMEQTENALFVSIHQNHYSVEKYSGLQVFYSPEFSEESSKMAQSIQETITETLQPDNNREIKKCGNSVYLIYNAVKPAVLVECGFLSNIEETRLLKSDDYQKEIAYCIALGIFNYVNLKD